MQKHKKSSNIPMNVSEEYYQISQEILNSFHKYRPPVDLFQFREDIAKLYPYSRKDTRLTNEQIEKIHELCHEGLLFVSRTDHPIYSEHIINQVDLVLLDKNFKEAEATDIIIRALHMRLLNFINQPVSAIFELLLNDLMVFIEFILQDKHKIKLFMRRLYTEHTLVQHSLNSLFVGTWLLFETNDFNKLKKKTIEKSLLGLMLHDIGMSKIPSFILKKTTPLKNEEKDKIQLHPLLGSKMIQKLNLGFEEMTQAAMEHHERLDGSGYPNKLTEPNISNFGKLCAVADSFSAMITKRSYAEAIPPKIAVQQLANDAKRYASTFTTPLLSAYATGVLEEKLIQGMPSPTK